jgi:hypothetical protein
MNIGHLSDDQIQSYLDDRSNSTAPDVQEHLRSCAQCQRKTDHYRMLYSSLDQDPVPPLPANFASKIISRLAARHKPQWEKYESGFIVAFFLIGIAVSLYFINPLPLLTSTGNTILKGLQEYGSNLLIGQHGNLTLIIIALMIFVLVELIDKMILKPRL